MRHLYEQNCLNLEYVTRRTTTRITTTTTTTIFKLIERDARVEKKPCSFISYYEGNDHVVYNGTFYYYNRQKEGVVAFHMDSGRSTILRIPRNAQNEGRQGDMLTGLALAITIASNHCYWLVGSVLI